MEFIELIKTPKVDRVRLRNHGSKDGVEGTLCITGHHLLLSNRKDSTQELWVNLNYLSKSKLLSIYQSIYIYIVVWKSLVAPQVYRCNGDETISISERDDWWSNHLKM